MLHVPFALSLLTIAGGPAPDEPPVTVVVLPPDTAGLPADRRALVHDTVLARLPDERVRVVPRARVTIAMAGRAPDCAASPSCRAEVAEAGGARFVVHAAVTEPKSSDYAVRVQLFEVGTDDAIASFDDACTICSEADLERIVRERTLDVREALLRHLAPVEVTEPPAPIPPPVASAPSPVRTEVVRASPLGAAGWGVVGGGVASTIGGVVMLALQGSGAGCPKDPRGGPCIPLVYRTVVPGAVTTGVGVALLGAGVALVIAGKRRDARRASAQVTATPRSHGAAGVTITGRF